MEITISGTKVNITGDRIIGFALNNLVNTFTATTDLTSEWNYQLYVHMIVPDLYNIINLNWKEGTQNIYVDLTADMLPYSGRYEMQFIASNGELSGRTEIFEVWVQNSIDVAKAYDPIPSEFYQIEDNIRELNSHPPYPGPYGYWMIWNTNTNQYEQSTLPTGEAGSDKSFIFNQNVASNLWEINHNLNKFPSVTIIDSGNNIVIGEVTYINENSLQISFTSPFSGSAYLN